MSISTKIAYSVAIIAMHIFIYYVLLKNISPNPIIKHCGKAIICANLLCIIIFFKLYHTHMNSTLYTLLSSSLGVFWIGFVIACITFLITLCVRFAFGAYVLYKIETTIIFIAWCVIVLLVCLSFYLNAKQPQILEQDITIKNLKQPLNIVLLTDMHIDVLMDKPKVASIVEQVNNIKPDIIVLAGDIVDNYYFIVKDSMQELGNLRAKYGVFYALGNHEYYYDTYTILKSLNNLGITTLINQTITLRNLGINIAGIADLMGQTKAFKQSVLAPNLAKTLEYRDKEFPTLLISHQPKITNLFNGEDIDLVLSGHTHGGQIFPFQFLVLLDQPFLSGLYSFTHNNKTSQIFVSRGVGWWGMPMRLFKAREINLLRLIPDNSHKTNL